MAVELLERETPLRVLNAALDEAIGGDGRLALVSGEAGIGKTSLVERFTRERRDVARVLWGACDALITPRPLGPLHDMAAQLGGGWPTLLASNVDRNTLFAAFLHELQSGPMIAVFEDIHWADEATLDLLKFIGRRRTRFSRSNRGLRPGSGEAHPWFVGELGFWRRRAGDPVLLPDWAAEPFARHAAGDWRGAARRGRCWVVPTSGRGRWPMATGRAGDGAGDL